MNDQEQRSELRRFLKDRRARVDPVDVGITATGRRRVRGLRREEVADLAGIGVSWYTALESGEAEGVSEATVHAVATALRLSDSERTYLLTLAGRLAVLDEFDSASELLEETMRALAFPAYIVTASWDVLSCNDVFRHVWGIDEHEIPFNAVERLFLDKKARKLHADHFLTNITPVVAMLRSAIGRRPHHATLRRLCEQLLAEEDLQKLWDVYEVSDPLIPNKCTIQSAVGAFHYEALTLANPGQTSGIVVQIPDRPSRTRLERAMAARTNEFKCNPDVEHGPDDWALSVPIACTLSAQETRARVARWNTLVLAAQTSARVQAGVVRAEFRNETVVRNELEFLVAAERECCAFLHFDLSESGTAVVLTITPLNTSAHEDVAMLVSALGIVS